MLLYVIIIDTCQVKNEALSVLLLLSAPILVRSYRIQTLRNSASFVPRYRTQFSQKTINLRPYGWSFYRFIGEPFLFFTMTIFSQKSDGGGHGRIQPRRDGRQQLCPLGLSGNLWQVWDDKNKNYVDNYEEWFPVRASFAVLNDVCDRCYDLFRDHDVHSLCRWALIEHSRLLSFYG